MNIYEEIERFYLKKNPKMKGFLYFDRYVILCFVAMLFVAFFYFRTFTFLQSFLFVFGCFFVLLLGYFFFRFFFLPKTVQYNHSELVKLLISYHVSSKEDLAFIITHFRNKKGFKVKSDDYLNIIAVILSISAFLMAGFDSTEDTFQFSSFVGVIVVAIFAFFFLYALKKILGLWKAIDEEFYSEIESDLTVIYLNFDHYFPKYSYFRKIYKKLVDKAE